MICGPIFKNIENQCALTVPHSVNSIMLLDLSGFIHSYFNFTLNINQITCNITPSPGPGQEPRIKGKVCLECLLVDIKAQLKTFVSIIFVP